MLTHHALHRAIRNYAYRRFSFYDKGIFNQRNELRRLLRLG